MKNKLSVERLATPFAVVGFAGFMAMQILGLWFWIRASPPGWLEERGMLIGVVGLFVVAAMFVAWLSAIYLVAVDDELSSRARALWIAALVLTNLFGGTVFVLWRRWKRRHDHQPTPAMGR